MAERRERILDAAREIIGERGYEALTMRDLARASRVTVPTIYNLVGSKNQVLAAAVADQTDRFLAGIEQGGSPRPASRVISVLESCVAELLRLPGYYRTLLKLLFTSDSGTDVREGVDETLGSQLSLGVTALRESGALADWVAADSLVDSLRAHVSFAALQWADGRIDDEGLRCGTLYGPCLMLLALTTGPSHEDFRELAEQVQPGVKLSRAPRANPKTEQAS